MEIPSMNTEAACQEFSDLVESQAASCLWFMQEPRKISVMEPAAEMALNAIICHGTQEAWKRAKELQAWRSQQSK